MLGLKFSMELEATAELIIGKLSLIYPNGDNIIFTATSGARGWQSEEHLWVKGRGAIPPDFAYSVPTQGYNLSNPGIQGQFYHITPDPIVNSKGQMRGEFGIHLDANFNTSPGSAGCIVLITPYGWKRFQERMLALKVENSIDSIPLEVKYN